MIYSDDYQNVQKLFDELTPYDKVLFLEKNMSLYIDEELSDDDIEKIAKSFGMIYPYELTIRELLETIEHRSFSLKKQHIEFLRNIILNYDIKKEVKQF